jgi:hypothetical protein
MAAADMGKIRHVADAAQVVGVTVEGVTRQRLVREASRALKADDG